MDILIFNCQNKMFQVKKMIFIIDEDTVYNKSNITLACNPMGLCQWHWLCRLLQH